MYNDNMFNGQVDQNGPSRMVTVKKSLKCDLLILITVVEQKSKKEVTVQAFNEDMGNLDQAFAAIQTVESAYSRP